MNSRETCWPVDIIKMSINTIQKAEFRAGHSKRFIIRLKYNMQVTRTKAGKIFLADNIIARTNNRITRRVFIT